MVLVRTGIDRTALDAEVTALSAGDAIRRLREELQLRSSDIERVSRGIASAKCNPDYYLSHASLSDIEAGSTPSIYKLFSLAVALQVSFERILLMFGVDAGELSEYRRSDSSVTQIEPAEDRLHQSAPRNFDPDRDPARTDLLHSDIQKWTMLPKSLYKRLDPARYSYGLIGSKDDTMAEIIPPGSLVEIDKRDTDVRASGWNSLRERPIYFVWYRDGYTCSWCQQIGNDLILIPHPASRKLVERVRLPREARIIGRVVNAWIAFDLKERAQAERGQRVQAET